MRFFRKQPAPSPRPGSGLTSYAAEWATERRRWEAEIEEGLKKLERPTETYRIWRDDAAGAWLVQKWRVEEDRIYFYRLSAMSLFTPVPDYVSDTHPCPMIVWDNYGVGNPFGSYGAAWAWLTRFLQNPDPDAAL